MSARAETSTSNTRGQRAPSRLALAGGAVLAALALAEVAARCSSPPQAPISLLEFEQAVEQGHGTTFESVFTWDSELLWRLASDVTRPDEEPPFSGLVSNAQGLREDHPIRAGPHPGELRLLFLGDSVTFGYLVRNDQCFVELLERDLEARFPSLSIECINAGVPGYTLAQGLRFLEIEGLAYEPDLVVLNFGWNCRAIWSGGGDLERLARRAHARLPPALAWSRLARRLCAPSEHADGMDEPRARVTPEEFRLELERVRTLLETLEIPLVLLVGPGRFNLKLLDESRTHYQFQEYEFGSNLRLGTAGTRALVDGVEAFRVLARTHTIDDIFFDGVHPTALGHQELAAALARVLESWVCERIERP